MATISQSLRNRIKSSGLTQKQLEALSGVPQNTISRFLRGSTSLGIEKADKIDQALSRLAKSKSRSAQPEQADSKESEEAEA